GFTLKTLRGEIIKILREFRSRRALPSRNSLRVPVTASVTILKNVTRNGRCALAATHVKSARTQIIFAAMDENLVPSQPERRLRGNSREYLQERLVLSALP